jgi:hypothetical protein
VGSLVVEAGGAKVVTRTYPTSRWVRVSAHHVATGKNRGPEVLAVEPELAAVYLGIGVSLAKSRYPACRGAGCSSGCAAWRHGAAGYEGRRGTETASGRGSVCSHRPCFGPSLERDIASGAAGDGRARSARTHDTKWTGAENEAERRSALTSPLQPTRRRRDSPRAAGATRIPSVAAGDGRARSARIPRNEVERDMGFEPTTFSLGS